MFWIPRAEIRLWFLLPRLWRNRERVDGERSIENWRLLIDESTGFRECTIDFLPAIDEIPTGPNMTSIIPMVYRHENHYQEVFKLLWIPNPRS